MQFLSPLSFAEQSGTEDLDSPTSDMRKNINKIRGIDLHGQSNGISVMASRGLHNVCRSGRATPIQEFDVVDLAYDPETPVLTENSTLVHPHCNETPDIVACQCELGYHEVRSRSWSGVEQ